MDQIEPVYSENAPAPIGPYSQAVRLDGLLFTSGQVALDTSGNLIGTEIVEQTEQVMKNLAAVLAAAGTTLDRVIKTTVFLADLNDFAAMNEVYGRYFGEAKPARSTVEVARLPRDARVEIEVIARCAK
jgi:2-iminobutanoate/2-iminopropanoate deaminase